MDLGIALPTVSLGADRELVTDAARAADRLGFHSVWVADHILLPKDRKSVYPYPESTTEIAFTPGVMWLDPVASMGFVAGVTERVKIGTSVLVLPYRSPLVLANEVASLDVLSEGRIVLGVGVGWMDEEFASLGVPKTERAARTDEYIEVLRTLWRSDDPVDFHGRFVDFEGMQLATRPFTPGGPPIHVGGNTPPALERVGRLADGWLGFEVFLDGLGDKIATIRKAAEGAGRDPDAISLSVRRGLLPPFEVSDFLPGRRSIRGEPREVAAELSRYAEHGVGLMVFDLTMTAPEMIRAMEWLAADVAPEVESL